LSHSFLSFFFLSRYKVYRDEQAKLHAAWREREDARLAAIARGDPNPPPAEPDPTAEKEIGLLGLLKFSFFVFVAFLLAGKFVTGEWLWGSDALERVGANARRLVVDQYHRSHERLFSEKGLGLFDGSDPDRPVYIAVRVCLCVLRVRVGRDVLCSCRADLFDFLTDGSDCVMLD